MSKKNFFATNLNITFNKLLLEKTMLANPEWLCNMISIIKTITNLTKLNRALCGFCC